MKPNTLRCTVAAALLAAGAASAGQIVIYKQANFAGGAQTFNGEDTNLVDNGITDQASSIVVKSGRWQLCSQPNFQGDCQTLEPGEYASLPQALNHRIESLREVTRTAANDDKRYAANDRRDGSRTYADARDSDRRDSRYADGRDARRRDAGSIELFAGQSFRGRGVTLDRDASALSDQYDVSSVIVHEGTWQVCTGARFEGYCRTLDPGRYPTLGRLDNRIGSVRRIG